MCPPSIVFKIIPPAPTAQPLNLSIKSTLYRSFVVLLVCFHQVRPPSVVATIVPPRPTDQRSDALIASMPRKLLVVDCPNPAIVKGLLYATLYPEDIARNLYPYPTLFTAMSEKRAIPLDVYLLVVPLREAPLLPVPDLRLKLISVGHEEATMFP